MINHKQNTMKLKTKKDYQDYQEKAGLDVNDKNHVDDDFNPALIFNGTANDLLVAILNGDVDAKKVAELQLEARGYDKKGNWVGFEK